MPQPDNTESTGLKHLPFSFPSLIYKQRVRNQLFYGQRERFDALTALLAIFLLGKSQLVGFLQIQPNFWRGAQKPTQAKAVSAVRPRLPEMI